MTIELNKTELQFICNGLNLLMQYKLEEVNNYAVGYKGYNPCGMEEFTKLVSLSIDFDGIDKLEDKLNDYLKSDEL